MDQFNLREDRIRNTWNAIANDEIQKEPFWSDFVDPVRRRNQVVHSGMIDDRSVALADAEASIEVVEKLIEHIKDALATNGLSSWA